ncbi:hypothetical protein B0H14DRAFT_2598195 [Mycena olivaceomarginata]|nr:hypothetical protein B0H14DRAFT_2598195 [Mycena olivaceomarginata]
MQEVLLAGFYPGNPDLRDIVLCAISFNSLAGHGCIQLLLDQVSLMLPELADYELEAHLVIEILQAQNTYTVANPQMLIDQTINHMESLDDTRLKSSFYTALGHHWDSAHGPRRLQFLEKALSLAESCGDLSSWAKALVNISEVKRMMGDFHPSETRAQKAQRLAKLAGNLFEEARALCVGDMCCTDLGNYTSAIDMPQRARKAPKLWGMLGGHLDSQIANNEAEIHLKKSEYTEARSIHAEIIEHSSPDQDPYRYAFALLNPAEINIMAEPPKGKEHLQQFGLFLWADLL